MAPPPTPPSPWLDVGNTELLQLRMAVEKAYTDFSVVATVPVALEFLKRNDSIVLVLSDSDLKNYENSDQYVQAIERSEFVKKYKPVRALMSAAVIFPALTNAFRQDVDESATFLIVSRAGGDMCVHNVITEDAIDACAQELSNPPGGEDPSTPGTAESPRP